MAQTLKVTLPSALEAGSNYPKLGELRIPVKTVTEGVLLRLRIYLAPGSTSTINIVGSTTQFWDSTGTNPSGKSAFLSPGQNTFYFKPYGDFYFSIGDKFLLTRVGDGSIFVNPASGTPPIPTVITSELDIRELKYIPLTDMSGYGFFKGDLSQFNKTTLTSVNVSADSTSGSNKLSGVLNASTFNFSALTMLNLSGQNEITGDLTGISFPVITNLQLKEARSIIGTLANLNSGITSINLQNTNIVMNLSVLQNTSSMSLLSLSGSLAYGSVEHLANVTLSMLIELKGLNLSGDVSRLNDACYFFSNSNQTTFAIDNTRAHLSTTFWTSKRATRQYILALEQVRLVTGVDQFLIDMAALDLHPSAVSGGAWLRTLGIRGTRTAASDAAVSTLTGKGVTVVMINP